MIVGLTPLRFSHVAISLVDIGSGFFLPADRLPSSHVLGILSLVALAIAIGSPFANAELVALVFFVALGVLAAKRFHVEPAAR